MYIRTGDAVIGTLGVIVVAAYVVLAIVGAVSLTQWVSGIVGGLVLISFVSLHAIVGLGTHQPTRIPPTTVTQAAVSALISIARRIRHRVRHYRREAAAARCLICANEYGNFEHCLSASQLSGVLSTPTT
jgi:hypothetical protein